MERLRLALISILCLFAAGGHATSRSIDNFPEIADYIDLAIDEITQKYEYEIEQLHRKLEDNQRTFDKEISAMKREREAAETYFTEKFSAIRTDIDILEEKMCPATPNTSLGLPEARAPTAKTPIHARDKVAEKEETQTQNSKRDIESHEGSTNYYKEHPSAVPVPTFLTVQTKVVVNEGEMAKLRCRIENLGTKMNSWRKTTDISPLTLGEATLSPDLRLEVAHEEISETVSEWDLIINDVRKRHAGVYECQVSWRKTTDISPLTLGEATFSPDLRLEVAHEEISETVSEWDLIINDVRKRHAGVYECQISATDAYTMNVTLTVLDNSYGYNGATFNIGSNDGYYDPKEYKPVITVRGTEYVSLMGEIKLKCNVTGAVETPNRVDWFFEGDPMDQVKPKWYGRLQVLDRKPLPGRSYISEIILEQATMEDRGNYVCRSGQLADGFKVHVLNDKRPYSGDQRRNTDADDEVEHAEETGSRYSMSGSAETCFSQVHISVLTTFCYTLFRLLLHS